jgi:hypothetical protein
MRFPHYRCHGANNSEVARQISPHRLIAVVTVVDGWVSRLSPATNFCGGLAGSFVLSPLYECFGGRLALQLQSVFDVSLSCRGLVSASPEGPCNDVGRTDAPLRQLHRNAPDLLD